MNTNELVTRLQAAYPGREIQVVPKRDTAYVDDTFMPEQLVGMVHEDFLIINPFATECGRFEVDPSAYGIADVDAHAMHEHNGLGIAAERQSTHICLDLEDAFREAEQALAAPR